MSALFLKVYILEDVAGCGELREALGYEIEVVGDTDGETTEELDTDREPADTAKS